MSTAGQPDPPRTPGKTAEPAATTEGTTSAAAADTQDGAKAAGPARPELVRAPTWLRARAATSSAKPSSAPEGDAQRAPRRYNIIVNRPAETQSPDAKTGAADPAAASDVDDGFGPAPFPTAGHTPPHGTPPPPEGAVSQAELSAVAAEGLRPQSLRMARRLALKRGLAANSDAEAVIRLRRAGIDPFSREPILPEDAPAPAQPGGKAEAADTAPTPGLPARRPDAPPPAQPLPQPSDAAAEVMAMRAEIVRRRRIRAALLVLRLAFFVLLPTLLAGYYFARVATPLFASNTEMIIQMAESGAGASSSAGLFTGSAVATVQDSVAVQGYLESREAMLRLDSEHGFRTAFAAASVDPIQRLAPDASTEEAYRTYQRSIRISFDPTEGLIRMEVRAPSAQLAATWSRALISYAEEQVDNLSRRLRDDRMAGARESYAQAEAAMQAAQARVIALQERYNVLSGDAEASLVTSRISSLEDQLLADRIGLAELQANATPNQARIAPIERRMAVLEAEIARLRARLTGAGAPSGGPGTEAGATGLGAMSLARVQGELMVAQSDMETRKALLGQALQQMEAARIEASRQVRYLSVSVAPLEADEAIYPRVIENTALVALILMGVYLMLALTAAVLREQVTG